MPYHPLFQEAVSHHAKGELAEAQRRYEALMEQGHHQGDCAANLSVIYLVGQQFAKAEQFAHMAIDQNDNDANGWNNLGLALKAQGQWVAARNAFAHAVQRDQSHENAWSNLAEACDKTGDPEKGLHASAMAIKVKPDWGAAHVQYVYRKLNAADWQGLDQSIQKMSSLLRQGACDIDPFLLLFICNAPEELQMAARAKASLITQAARQEAAAGTLLPCERPPSGKIRIGYVSANFNAHAVSAHILEALENHDTDKYEVYCYCHTPEPAPLVVDRLRHATITYKSIRDLSNLQAANEIRQDGIDILVDLMGYTDGARLQIFAHRPAPVQLTWIGFPGTIGADWMDYNLADPIVVPGGADKYYDEKIIRLPCSYQANDSTRLIDPVPPKRQDYGLPETGPILCCFNKPAKINPRVVALWTEILRKVPDATLWLWALTPMAEKNLRKVFEAADIEPRRLVMAQSVPLPIHLARHRLCDLFLDTFPYSGHATASNALYAGCPVITLAGPTFAARVSASLLHDLQLDELIATHDQDYIDKAVALLQDATRLSEIKSRLHWARQSAPLFQGKAFVREFERAIDIAIDKARHGMAPAAITLNPQP
ncbi:MAG: O-linked N-acetylglucosamine transferase, SPINDLY family protein [bacterium]